MLLLTAVGRDRGQAGVLLISAVVLLKHFSFRQSVQKGVRCDEATDWGEAAKSAGSCCTSTHNNTISKEPNSLHDAFSSLYGCNVMEYKIR